MDFLHRIRQGLERLRLEEEYNRSRARERREARRLEEEQRQQREREDHERQRREREDHERRRHEVERRQRDYEQRNQRDLLLKISALKSVCEGHSHYIPSVPIPVQRNNVWMSVGLLHQYFEEKEIDIEVWTGYEILFNNAVLKSFGGNPIRHLEPGYKNAVLKSFGVNPILQLKPEYKHTSVSLDFFTYADFKNFEFDDHGREYLIYVIGGRMTAYSELRKFRLMGQSANKVWYLTPKGTREAESLIADVERWHNSSRTDYSSHLKGKRQTSPLTTTNSPDLLSRLQSMPPDSFERLCQQLLLKSGIEDVKVTGRTGDEGIDGQGVMRAQGLITAPVVFQAKRYSGSVGVPKVRDFRGAMDGRASAGILITTGTFTKQAYAEAEREGTAKIRLIDGNELVALLKKHEIVLESL